MSASSTTAARGTAGPARSHARADIQGLRALAVGLVVVYHLWPHALPGGFVGVDVFFVISGYLIIGSLVREVSRTGTVRLATFYTRRIRRLLPASTVVIVLSVVATLLVLPASQWRTVLESALTSALQVQNWALAYGPDEYAQATAGVSPFQHFWSLAVEEQFYLVVPLVLLAVGLVTSRRRDRTARVVLTVLGAVVVASLAWSVVLSGSDPGAAYFVTTTRAWELAIGGLVAVLLPRVSLRPRAWSALAALGLVAVVVSAFVYSTDMAFPGWVALVPTVGTALLLAAGGAGPAPTVVSRALSARPAVYVGDISYSLYLWHWPLIVFVLAWSGQDRLTVPLSVGVVLLSLGLAAASTRWVEAPFRRGPAVRPVLARHARAREPLARTFALGGSLVAASVLVALVPLAEVTARTEAAANVVAGEANPGAAVFEGASAPSGAPVAPDPLVAASDVGLVNRDGCIDEDITLPVPDGETRSPDACRYGADDGPGVVLVGDSHAAVLSSPLARAAEENGYALTVLVRNGCPFNVDPMSSNGIPFGECGERNRRNQELILRERPELVVVSAMTPAGYRAALDWGWDEFDDAVAGYRETLEPIVDAGIRVVVVRDTPLPPFVAPECVAEHGAASPECAFPRGRLAAQDDPLVDAARALGEVEVVDLTDSLCRADTCRAVEGNVLVYRDNHLTDTYALSLEPRLESALGLQRPAS
ncbi:acyltransferase [Cellulosimicrobium cellulans]|uniref:acyltransferase family protein n=1 Tax=Cellulosimicrobium cellulans TaxID=1710 RepID=UPI002149E4E8|nr:acyltransferase [Cellulosimicrobium cellulans]